MYSIEGAASRQAAHLRLLLSAAAALNDMILDAITKGSELKLRSMQLDTAAQQGAALLSSSRCAAPLM
jgi:hypothetical protein